MSGGCGCEQELRDDVLDRGAEVTPIQREHPFDLRGYGDLVEVLQRIDEHDRRHTLEVQAGLHHVGARHRMPHEHHPWAFDPLEDRLDVLGICLDGSVGALAP